MSLSFLVISSELGEYFNKKSFNWFQLATLILFSVEVRSSLLLFILISKSLSTLALYCAVSVVSSSAFTSSLQIILFASSLMFCNHCTNQELLHAQDNAQAFSHANIFLSTCVCISSICWLKFTCALSCAVVASSIALSFCSSIFSTCLSIPLDALSSNSCCSMRSSNPLPSITFFVVAKSCHERFAISPICSSEGNHVYPFSDLCLPAISRISLFLVDISLKFSNLSSPQRFLKAESIVASFWLLISQSSCSNKAAALSASGVPSGASVIGNLACCHILLNMLSTVFCTSTSHFHHVDSSPLTSLSLSSLLICSFCVNSSRSANHSVLPASSLI